MKSENLNKSIVKSVALIVMSIIFFGLLSVASASAHTYPNDTENRMFHHTMIIRGFTCFDDQGHLYHTSPGTMMGYFKGVHGVADFMLFADKEGSGTVHMYTLGQKNDWCIPTQNEVGA